MAADLLNNAAAARPVSWEAPTGNTEETSGPGSSDDVHSTNSSSAHPCSHGSMEVSERNRDNRNAEFRIMNESSVIYSTVVYELQCMHM